MFGQAKNVPLYRRLLERELNPKPLLFSRDNLVDDRLIELLTHSKTLRGHTGCVNCLQWNQSGTVLASGSDDTCIRLWNACGECIYSFGSSHMNNIFSVQFLPSGNDNVIITASGDNSARMHTLSSNEPPRVWWSGARVKRLAVTSADPQLFWSADEEGCIKQYDVREFVSKDIIVSTEKECKSLAINEAKPEMLAVAFNDALVPIYDRRNLLHPIAKLIPGHIPLKMDSSRGRSRSLTVTHVGFNSSGNELIVNIGGEQIYIFNVLSSGNEPDTLQRLTDFIEMKNMPKSNAILGEIEQRTTDRFRAARERAKISFNSKLFTDAIEIYNKAILECERLCGKDPQADHPHAIDLCVLLANRGAGYLCRQWDGDSYACLLDMLRVLRIEPRFTKAYYRLIKSLTDLKQYHLANKVAHFAEQNFANYADYHPYAVFDNKEGDAEINWKSMERTIDYVQRLCGHCNINTDIKEAAWFGSRDEYIAAGSDCGSLLIWDRNSGSLLKAFEADRNILNCVQPHPSTCLIATSGIEHVIRFWEPIESEHVEDGERSRERRSLSSLSAANQKRMHTGIFEMVVASLGMLGADSDNEGNAGVAGCTTN